MGALNPQPRISRRVQILVISLLVLISTCVLAVCIGDTRLPFWQVLLVLGSRLFPIKQTWSKSIETIILKYRLPRVLSGMVVGSSLAVAGVTYQGLFQNPLADPLILGISSGAAVAASVAILLGLVVKLGMFSLTAFAFVGGLGTVVLVYGLARTQRGVFVNSLILSGVIVSAFLSAVLMLFISLSPQHSQMLFWLMGSLDLGEFNLVAGVGIFALFCIGILIFYARDINVLSLGEESASQLGVNVERLKLILFVLGSLLTAAAVSISGLIGFVGLVVPHIFRMIMGPDHRWLIPGSALGGAAFLVFADLVARTASVQTDLPIGVVTAMIGAPFFFYLLKRQNKDVGM